MSIHLLEQLVRKRGLDIQTGFAAEAAKRLGPQPIAMTEATPRGLRLLAENERGLAEATAALRNHYPEVLEIGEPRVRYQSEPEPAEPVMWIVIDIPSVHLPLLRTNLLGRRAVLRDCETSSATGSPEHTRLCALAPLSELLGYETELDFLVDGHARLEMGFSHYAPLHGGGPDGAA
ncbi:MAG: hypothetical protein DWQ09_05820 [Proteobacteria bacterium]|nr:MAG: hypothetical protein DWQ09_05820 [Pseudomonadota bacterium]QKK11458.1 MAG: hypothetical protein HND59_07515 [Pseudomonadota bacterium]